MIGAAQLLGHRTSGKTSVMSEMGCQRVAEQLAQPPDPGAAQEAHVKVSSCM